MTALRNPHPGEILKHEFLAELGLSQNRLAKAMIKSGVSVLPLSLSPRIR